MKPVSLFSRLRAWLNDIPVRDAIDRRMATLLQVMLIGFMFVIVIGTVLSLIIAPATDSRQEKLIYNAIFLFVVWAPFFLLRRGHFRASVFTIIAAFIGIEAYVIVYSDLGSAAGTLSLLTLAILLAGLLIGRQALLVTFLLATTAVLIGVFWQRDPQLRLDGVGITGNFILLNGLMSIFLGRFDRILRTALKNALERENDLKREIAERERIQAEHEKLIAQLESNNAELERFTYTVSHDLRSPLVTIKGFVGMLQYDIQANRQDKVQHDMQRIESAADKMEALLSELLELSRIGRIVNQPEEVDTVQLIHDAMESMDAQLQSQKVTVRIADDLPKLYGDRIRLREVFENLIGNAAKYMGDQTEPVIDIGVRVGKNEPVIFVKDNGMGIDPKYHTRIFNLFEKLNPAIDGTGIGLTIVKRIIEVHGGKIWIESEGQGKGSTFCFTIPDSRK
jgi:signal transduction histidine kinase